MATQASSLQPEVDALIQQLNYTYMDIPELIEESDDELPQSLQSQQQSPQHGHQTQPEACHATQTQTDSEEPSTPKQSERCLPHRDREQWPGACRPPVHPPTPFPYWATSQNQPAKKLLKLPVMKEEDVLPLPLSFGSRLQGGLDSMQED